MMHVGGCLERWTVLGLLPLATVVAGCGGATSSSPSQPAGSSVDAAGGGDAGSAGMSPGQLGGSDPDSGALPTTCTQSSDCDTHDPCTTFTCDVTGTGEAQEGHCVYAPFDGGACGPEAGAPDSGTVGQPPIDMACMSSQNLPAVFPPYVPLVPPDVPASCANGFEIGDAMVGGTTVYSLAAKNQAQGAAAITLDVDFATYEEPDGVIITGVDASGVTYTLLDTCRLQTWTKADPTGGTSRPPDITIRQFRIDVKAGTQSLKVDFGGVVSPMYIQVLGLCDFDVSMFSQAKWWTPVP